MLKYSLFGENVIRVYVDGVRENMSWAEFDFSGNITKECNRGTFLLPGLTDEEKEEASYTIKTFKTAPFENVYLRFNELPKSGRSKNHATGKMEKGVSCYALEWDLINGSYKRCGAGLDGAMIYYAMQGSPIYFITGQETGLGSDGEPLLTNVKIVCKAIFDKDRNGYIPSECE